MCRRYGMNYCSIETFSQQLLLSKNNNNNIIVILIGNNSQWDHTKEPIKTSVLRSKDIIPGPIQNKETHITEKSP